MNHCMFVTHTCIPIFTTKSKHEQTNFYKTFRNIYLRIQFRCVFDMILKCVKLLILSPQDNQNNKIKSHFLQLIFSRINSKYVYEYSIIFFLLKIKFYLCKVILYK